MYTKVDPWFDIIKQEHKIQDFWNETKAFDTLRELRKDSPRWSFLDGPITANNPMGVHHAWGRTLKDVYQRYFAMTGHQLRYQNGFDCQGLWVEVEVEKELGFKSKLEIEKFGVGRFVDKCKERVLKFSKIQTEQSIRLGYWMDWDNSYFTMSDTNNYTIWNFLKKYHHRDLVYRGTDVMPWCPRCGVGLSQMEMHEGYKATAHRALFVRFPLRERKDEYFLVWTTTPWTLTSNVALAINPELKYARVKAGDGIYYLAEDTLNYKRKEEAFKAGESGGWIKGVPPLKTPTEFLSEAYGSFEVLEIISGQELLGLSYDGPFDDLPVQQLKGGFPENKNLTDRSSVDCHKVIKWDLVSSTEGTGIVHSAPGCGKEDYGLATEFGLVALAPLDQFGVYGKHFGWLEGLNAQSDETTNRIIEDLKKKGYLVHTEKYPHTYPHCWRCGTELLFRLVDEWFIAMDSWKHEIMEIVEDIRWIPSFGKDQELDWLHNMRDWMISKKRYWGLALPIWVCDDEECGHFDVIGGQDELKAAAISGWDEFEGHSPHRPWIDKVKIKCAKCDGIASRIGDVGNPWLDAGIVPYSTMGYTSDREYWKKWFPPALVLECFPGQFRNWFYALLSMSTIMEGKAPFQTLLGHGLVRDEKGQEMHKSTGNAIWFDDAVDTIGADVMRWIYCNQEPTSNLNFGFDFAREVRGRFINTLWNTYAFFVNYARIDQFIPSQNPTPLSERPHIDQWAISNCQKLIKIAHKGYPNFDCRTVARAVEKFINDLSNWYVRRSRRRFWKGKESDDSINAYETLYECLVTVSKVLAPMLPFLTEEIYQNLVRSHDPQAPKSLHHCDFPKVNEALIDEELSAQMEVVIQMSSAGLAARNKAAIRVRQPLSEVIFEVSDEHKRTAIERFSYIISSELNIKKVVVLAVDEKIPVAWNIRPEFSKLGPKFGKLVKKIAAQIQSSDLADLVGKFRSDGKISLTVDGQDVEVDASEVDITWKAADGLALVEEGDDKIAIRTTITEPLLKEGLIRDMIRKVQMLRKESGFEIEDRIHMKFDTESELLQDALKIHGEFACSELLCLKMVQSEKTDGWHKLDLRENVIWLELTRV